MYTNDKYLNYFNLFTPHIEIILIKLIFFTNIMKINKDKIKYSK